MSIQSSLGRKLLRAAVALGALGCVITAGTMFSRGAVRKSTVELTKAECVAGVATPDCCESRCAISDSSDLLLTAQLEIGVPDEFGFAFEDDDAIEMLRVDVEQRLFGIDHEVIGPRIASHSARNVRSGISSPLLV